VVWATVSGAAAPPADAPPEAPGTTPAEPPQPATAGEAGDPAAAIFLQKCAGCHTVGKGKLTGPDLIAATSWAEPDLARAVKNMETRVGPLGEQEIAALVALVKSVDVRERIAAESERVARAAAARFDPGDAHVGRMLFTGARALENGGPACASCHSVDGSAAGLGPDLSGVFAKLGETPLVSACENASFKVMDAAYRDHAVTRQEALHLTKYLEEAGKGGGEAPAPRVGAIGAAAGAVAFALVALGYRRRHPGARRTLLRRRHGGLD
jgi:mono/diheme cytochrome c family protein